MYRLKIKLNSKLWKLGINVYQNMQSAQVRQQQLKDLGITSIIVDHIGGEL